MSVEDICRELNNYFDEASDGTRERYYGIFTVVDGAIDLSGIDAQEGQYFRIVGSVFNDGVYQYPAEGLIDEVFSGAVWLMAVPKAVLDLVSEIDAWQEKYGSVDSPAMSPYNSESFGGYSYSKASNGSNASNAGTSGTWQTQFASRLNKWRKIRAI